jgi:hypothetical protein
LEQKCSKIAADIGVSISHPEVCAARAVFCEMKNASAHDVTTTNKYLHKTGNAFFIAASFINKLSSIK